MSLPLSWCKVIPIPLPNVQEAVGSTYHMYSLDGGAVGYDSIVHYTFPQLTLA